MSVNDETNCASPFVNVISLVGVPDVVLVPFQNLISSTVDVKTPFEGASVPVENVIYLNPEIFVPDSVAVLPTWFDE